MTTATIAALTDFINAQPADRQVNNTSWAACIVGDYAREMLDHQIPVFDGESDNVYDQLIKDTVLCALWADCGSSAYSYLAEVWNVEFVIDGASTFMDLLEKSEFCTYGEAQEYLKAR